MGTPYYMAPEQARGAKNLDARLDVYAAGVILFEAATGRVPFDGDTFNELLIKIVTEEAPPVRQLAPDLDPGLADIIDRARQKNPDQRFASAREFRDALAGWLEGATSAVATGATLPLGAAGPVVPGAHTELVGGAGLAAREVIPANTAAGVAVAVSPTVAFGSPGDPSALGKGTGQAWANTQAALSREEPKQRSGRNVMVAGGAAVVLAGLVLVFKLQSDTASSAAQAAATSASVERQFHEAREEASRKLDEERARSRELEAKEEARRMERERAEATALQQRVSADEERRREEAKAKVVEAQRQRAAARPPAPSRSSASPASRRRIRTSL
jgi:hypothetical protein